MARYLIGFDEVETFEDVKREVAANPKSQPIDHLIAASGEALLRVLERQFSPGRSVPEAAFSYRKKLKLPGRYVVAPFDASDLKDTSLNSGIDGQAEALVERAIERLFGKIRVSDLTEAARRSEQLYALYYAGILEGLGKLHGVQLQAIDVFTPLDKSMEHNYFQRAMMDILDGGLGSFMTHGKDRSPSHLQWELASSMGQRDQIPSIRPVPLFSTDRLSIVRVKGAGLEECIRSLEDISREAALRLGEVARVRDAEEPRRPRKRAA